MPRVHSFSTCNEMTHPELPRVRTTAEQRDEDAAGTPSPTSSAYTPALTENFMMYGFKIALCSKQGRHPWGDCPFAHPTENARRRDPRLFSYGCHECPSYRNSGFCTKGDECEFSHGVFEARLHPDSYRTIECKDGANCRRKICFFYHKECEQRAPTGLQDARAQLSAEIGEAALDLDALSLRNVANSILTSNPSLAGTMRSLNSSKSQPVCQHQTSIRTALSSGTALSVSTNTSPLAATSSIANNSTLNRVLSGNIPNINLGSASSGIVMSTETVAPCMKGANRNKVQMKELAGQVGIHADILMNSLRVSALQGELSRHSAAPGSPRGTVSSSVESILSKISRLEDCPIDKLRGWLLRQNGLSPAAHTPSNNHSSPFGSAQPTEHSVRCYPSAMSGAMHRVESPIRAHFGNRNGGLGGGGGSWSARHNRGGSLESFNSFNARPSVQFSSGADAARW